MTTVTDQVLILGAGRFCTIRDMSDSFIEVVFNQRPTCDDYGQWLKKGYLPLFSPVERTCNKSTVYEVTFKVDRQAPSTDFVPYSDLSARDKDKVIIQQSIHDLRSLLDSEAEFKESEAVANKAYEALGRL